MTEIKIRVKDLIRELDVPAKDMLRALRDLGLPSQSTAGSVEFADADRLRDYFISRKKEEVETTVVQPGPDVIVRRRRKEPSAPINEAKEALAAKVTAPAPEPKEEPVKKEPRPARPTRKSLQNVGAREISRPGDKPASASEPETVAATERVPEP